jgi:hypothetical protein|uniref:Uncharacterized protein n=1 Tax=Myoviridae sp. ctWb16 TaxID=2827690 RepID=A0A8S5T0N8_9CAUD|nr:MAG TPA: hypothetical protein [Myoviridae sp. ctWb16]
MANSLLLNSDLAYNKIKDNLSKDIKNSILKEEFCSFLDKLRNKFKNENFSSYDIVFFNKILLPLTKKVYQLKE